MVFALAAALGGPLLAGPGGQVEAVRWARPFTVDQPVRYHHAAPARDITRGWLVELTVDPATMRPRQIGVPVLWIGADLGVRTHWQAPGGCAVVWVPGEHDLRAERIFFGSTRLPETLDAAAAAEEAAAAARAGIGPLPADKIGDVSGPTLRFADHGALLEAAAARQAACARAAP